LKRAREEKRRNSKTHLRQMSPLLIHSLDRLRPLLPRLHPIHNHRNLDLCQRSGESIVEGERIRGGDLPRSRILGEDSVFPARERLKRSSQVGCWDLGRCGDVLRSTKKSREGKGRRESVRSSEAEVGDRRTRREENSPRNSTPPPPPNRQTASTQSERTSKRSTRATSL